ncbi:hypothetical protein FGG08_006286 [Glutinoglossum americanum]|uniref:Maltose/galactoside acetyltransferase domain-containing protein n=1 Tax=Glutinoglossum americanum TaxID=1670608 RepID=A0A9P8KXM8_9PEZI|nr:hypothetical protein FGG08_006286 [Glutinoglossum americanum]
MSSSVEEEREKMCRGEWFYAWHPGLAKERQRAHLACRRYNKAGETNRRKDVEMWREIVNNPTPLPGPSSEIDDDVLLGNEPYIEPPFYTDYGYNIHMGEQVYMNFNCTILDSCAVHIGSRTLIGPNVSLYTAMHSVDPVMRDGLKGPEMGKEIRIGEDCWIGGNVVVLPGVTIGDGSTIGAGSVVTKSVPPYTVAAGNPARIIRSLPQPSDKGDGVTAEPKVPREDTEASK